MAEVSEEVVALTDDVVIIRDALNLAYHQNISLDMADAYREYRKRPNGRSSELTSALGEALAKAEALIKLAETDEPDSEQDKQDQEG